MNKGIVFTLMSVLIALSLFSLLTNYRLFVSELEAGTPQDIGIPQTFLYAGSHVQKITDMEVRVTFNKSHTFVNFTDKAPRDARYNDSLKAYRDFLVDKMNFSYTFDFNATVPVAEPAFEIKGMNAQYNYSNFTKHNISVLQREVNTNFLKSYEVFVGAINTACTPDKITTINENTGELNISIFAGTQISRRSVSRTLTSLYMVNFTPSATCPSNVNISVGKIAGFNSSLRVDPKEKASINITLIAKTGELPKS